VPQIGTFYNKQLIIFMIKNGSFDNEQIGTFYNKHIGTFYTGRCEKFIFGGCKENGNNFKSEDECERVCGSHGLY
jgi:methionyl-tRNA synthetase